MSRRMSRFLRLDVTKRVHHEPVRIASSTFLSRNLPGLTPRSASAARYFARTIQFTLTRASGEISSMLIPSTLLRRFECISYQG